MTIRRFEQADVAAIQRFNERLRGAGLPHVLYTEPPDRVSSDGLSSERLFVVADGNEIRGGAFLRGSRLWIRGKPIPLGWVKFPVAESLVDRQYSGVPAALLLHLMRIQPNLVAVGMGGRNGPFAQLLARFRWVGGSIPTWVCPLRPDNVMDALPQLKNSRLRRLAVTAAKGTGAAAAGGVALRLLLRNRLRRSLSGIATSQADSFDEWADETWHRCAPGYDALTYRDAPTLEWRYPTGAIGLVRLQVLRAGSVIGWTVLQIVDLRTRPDLVWLGPLTVGLVLDAFSLPVDAETVMAAAMSHFLGTGVDLAIANQANGIWQSALRRAGFLPGPDNFAFYRSAGLERELTASRVAAADVMISRGDDGLLV